MLRPLHLDALALLLPIGLGTLSFATGRRLHSLPRSVRAGFVGLALATIGGGVAYLAERLPDRAGEAISAVGGATVLLSWASLLLLGVAWSAPTRRMSRGFLSCIVGVAGCLLLIEGGSRLWWRYAAPALWHNVPDDHGYLRQTSGFTCAPAAAAMLLHCHGITASEGEMAYLSGTSLFGSDAWQTTAALDRKCRPSGWRATTGQMQYDECVRNGTPFIAHVQGDSGGHAILVRSITVECIEVVDPLEGFLKRMTHADFKAVWDGTVVTIVPGPE